MLNINNLCIGDYIKYINRIYKIIQIDYKGFIYAHGNDFSMPRVAKDIELFEPIKITSEIIKPILTRLKWSNIDVYWVMEIDNYFIEFYPSTGTFIKYTYIVDENNNYEQHIIFLCNCYYIHELQHAMRAVGCEKEIELYE